METFEFAVWDQTGFWGTIRQSATTASTAERLCRNYLKRCEVEPEGCLLPSFWLCSLGSVSSRHQNGPGEKYGPEGPRFIEQ